MPSMTSAVKRALCAAALLAAALPLMAVEPMPLSYQGKLTDAQGNLRNGTFSMEFGIYDDPAAGTLRFNDAQTVSVSSGVFSVLIGAGSVAGPDTLGQTMASGAPRYLQIKVGGNALLPRQRRPAGPYALSVADGSVTGAKLAAGIFNNITGLGTQAQTLDMREQLHHEPADADRPSARPERPDQRVRGRAHGGRRQRNGDERRPDGARGVHGDGFPDNEQRDFCGDEGEPDGEPGVCGSRFGSPRGAVVPISRGGGPAGGGRGPWRDGGDGPSDRPG